METLIEDVPSFARGGEAIVETESVDLSTVAHGSWKKVETGGAALVADVTRRVLADESRMRQLFENLFRNAVEHGSDDVIVTVGELDGGFYVEDDGPGIAPDERDDVFEAGYSTTPGGTGFGLSIVEQVADAHDWTISITESEGGGARFDVTGVEAPPTGE